MNDSELKVFLEALPDYFEHLKENPNSLIARIYGVYKVKMEDIVPVNLLVMANTNRVKSSTLIMNIYDLKGSVINRERKWDKKLKNTSTLKDLNLIRIRKQNEAINYDFLKFTKPDISMINEMLRKDVELLKKYNLMDYSLLLCVEHVESEDPDTLSPEEGESPEP
jgi:1-phosphatidylinositol-4-phosphate 5-kinase